MRAPLKVGTSGRLVELRCRLLTPRAEPGLTPVPASPVQAAQVQATREFLDPGFSILDPRRVSRIWHRASSISKPPKSSIFQFYGVNSVRGLLQSPRRPARGPTVPEIAQLLTDNEPLNKAAFSCCGAEPFNTKLNELARQQVLLCGIEAHVCIYQTAVDLLRKGFSVDVLADVVSSRTLENKQIAISRMAAERINISCTEMALFELLKTAEHPKFKQIAALIK